MATGGCRHPRGHPDTHLTYSSVIAASLTRDRCCARPLNRPTDIGDAMSQTGKTRDAQPEKYPEVEAHLDRVEEELSSLRSTLQNRDTLRYADIERMGSSVMALLGKAAAAAWD